MKLSTAVFASILSVCLTVSYVSGQIVFPDSTVQTTAAGGGVFIMQPGDAFEWTNFNYATGPLTPVGPSGPATENPYGFPIMDPVPAGYELVILYEALTLGSSSYDTSYVWDASPELDLFIAPFITSGSPGRNSNPSSGQYFPNGTVVIDEGHTLYAGKAYPTYTGTQSWPQGTILGYYRQK